MNLQELVTESTFQSQGETTILEIFRSPARLSPEDCLLAIESYRAGLDIIARDKVVAETTRALLALRGLEEPFHTIFFLYALDYQEEGNAESLDFLRKGADEWISRMKKSAREELIETLVGNRERSLDYLGEVWGDGLPDMLVRLTGKSLSSARRWIRGGGASQVPNAQICAWARVVYLLREERGWDKNKIKSWSETRLPDEYIPIPDRHTPLKMFRKMLLYLCSPGVIENYFLKFLPPENSSPIKEMLPPSIAKTDSGFSIKIR